MTRVAILVLWSNAALTAVPHAGPRFAACRASVVASVVAKVDSPPVGLVDPDSPDARRSPEALGATEQARLAGPAPSEVSGAVEGGSDEVGAAGDGSTAVAAPVDSTKPEQGDAEPQDQNADGPTVDPEGPPTSREATSQEGSRVGSDRNTLLPAEPPARVRWEGPQGRKARKLVIAGSVALGVGGLLAIGAAVYGSVASCNYRAGNNCFADAQDRATATMAAPGALLLIGGASMVGVGLKRERDLAKGSDAKGSDARQRAALGTSSAALRRPRGTRTPQVVVAPFVLGTAAPSSLMAALERRASSRGSPDSAAQAGLAGTSPRTRISGAGLMISGRF